MGFLLGIASFLLVLIPLVIIHELGHFIAAKLVGITVLEFGIGFPPRAKILFSRGDTIYTLNWLPIGGFVRPYGEDFVRPKSEEELTTDQQEIRERGIKHPKSVNQANPWQRIFFMVSGPGINFLAALLLLIGVALVGWPFTRADVTIYDITAGSPAAQAGLQPGDVLLKLNGQTIKSADEFNNQIKKDANQSVTLLVERDGKQFETPLTANVVEESDVERAYITALLKDMPAAAAGLKVEDVITAVDGVEIKSIKQLQDYTKAREGQEMQVTILRGNQELVIPVTPKKQNGEVLMGIEITGVKPAIIGLTAVNRDVKIVPRALPVGEAIKTGTEAFVNIPKLLVQTFSDLLTGKIAPSAARPVSPIGIGQIGGPVLEQSLDERQMYPIISFAAMISIALAVTNLLPIPGLDGGRILFVLIEIVRGKPLSPEREGLIHFIGLLFLLGLIALTVINDIVNPININTLK